MTAVDIALSAREGYRSVEHLKRYTTQGMWTDQGKTGDVNALAILAEIRKEPIPLVGTTAFRPPYTPVTISAYAGYRTGLNYRPVRRTPMYEWHVSHGAVMVNTGLWKRSDYYPRAGEGQQEAINREVKAVRPHLLVHGDNLRYLQSLDAGSVQLIYTDPPFNTGKTRSRVTIRVHRGDDGDRNGFGGRRYRTAFRSCTTTTVSPVRASRLSKGICLASRKIG